MPRVSIIVPALNTQEFIPRLFACVDRRTFRDIELVVIDDASDDRTAVMREEMASVTAQRLLRTGANSGPTFAPNMGIAACDSEFAATGNAEDLMCPSRSERLVPLVIENIGNSVAAISGQVVFTHFVGMADLVGFSSGVTTMLMPGLMAPLGVSPSSMLFGVESCTFADARLKGRILETAKCRSSR